MRQLIFRLSRSSAARNVARVLNLTRLSNAWLRRFPLIKRLPNTNVIYRATRLESIPLAVEMFERNLYDASLLPRNFSTFADLGCNVGYFSCWLAHLASGRKIRGLMIDANPEAVKDAEWHAKANKWDEVFAANGVLGCAPGQRASEFFLYESNVCSTTSVENMESMGLKGKWTKISVPCLNLGALWKDNFGGTRCHLLKVDIEGAELDFLQNEAAFLGLVDSALVEWHKWRVKFDDLQTLLVSHGFTLKKILDEGPEMGTAFWGR